jgi:uncharacterized protein YdeI (YjbR/CyaY-like superfamily)
LGKILATLPDELENRFREHLRKQSDLSRIVSEALESYLDRIGKKAKKRSSKVARLELRRPALAQSESQVRQRSLLPHSSL